MTLKDYFEKSKGKGIIATADAKGKVGMAVYARPHFVDEKTAVFIMADRLMHKNLQENPAHPIFSWRRTPGIRESASI